MDSLIFLESPDPAKPQPLYVLHGDEDFLKRQAMAKLRRMVFAGDADSVPSAYPGDRAEFAEVFDELETVGFFTSRRMVVVEGADPFVTKYRAQLEKKVASLASKSVLVLDVKTWPANTRLAKLVPGPATIVCKAPPPFKVAEWCQQWALSRQQKQLAKPAASLLVDLVGPDMGLLDQEIEKLSLYVGTRARIDVKDVDALVGHSRDENVWKIIDAIVEGKVAQAMTSLERLFEHGEEPIAVAGAFNSQLRKLAMAFRLNSLGKNITASLEEVGVLPFALKNAENQLKHLGRRRLAKLYDWLIEVNMGMRGDSSLSKRTLLERLLVRLV